MSDFDTEETMLLSRDRVASMLAENSEQFIYTITAAIEGVDLAEALECGQLGKGAEAGGIVLSLREIANQIENGNVT